MYAVRDLSNRIVGGLSSGVLYSREGDPCAFIRGTEVFTFRRRHIGRYERGLFHNAQGEVVGTASAGERTPGRCRRRRWEITPRLRFSLPAPKRAVAFRMWAIWDRALDALAV